MKSKFKITQKFLDEHGIDIPFTELEGHEVKRISTDIEIKAIADQEVVGIISTIDIDSDGDIILPSAIDTSRYAKNPVCLFNHDMSNPVGYSSDMQILDDKILSTTKFADTPESQNIYQLLKAKVLRTFSIGYITRSAVLKGTSEFNQLFASLQAKYPGRFLLEKVNRIITDALLIEYSVVTVPSNENAYALSVKALEEKIETKDISSTINSSLDVTDEFIIEEPKINIKKVGSTKIRKVSSIEVEEQKKLNELYLKMWGI